MVRFEIDAQINCYSFEDDNLDDGQLKITTMYFDDGTVLLDSSYYQTKAEIENEGNKCIEGTFFHTKDDGTVLTGWSWDTVSEFDGTQKDFMVAPQGEVLFETDHDLEEVKAILNKPCDAISVSLVLEAGGQIDMSTTQLSDCEISKIK